MRVLLAGNPNCGKTTLFNRLTGSRARAGNRLGLTVEVRSATLSGGGAEIWDLPGLYRLDDSAVDGQLAASAIRGAGCDLIVNVLDATRLAGSLYLATQLLLLRIPMVVVLNMSDEAAAQGMELDADALEKALGVPVVRTSAAKGHGLSALRGAILRGGAVPSFFCRDTPDARRMAIGRLLLATVRNAGRAGRYAPDRTLLHPVWGVLAFLLLMACVFTLTFDTLGRYLSGVLDALLLGTLRPLLMECLSGAPPFVSGLLIDGLWTGVCGVITFLPQIMLLTALLTLLEDAGILSRAAFLFDGLLRAMGLSGGAVVPLLLGFGCSVPAALACRTLYDPRERQRAMWLVPFVPCAAKLPVFLLVCRTAFPAHPALAVFLLYLASILCGVLASCVTRGRRREEAAFLLELPPYRVPAMRNVLPAVGARVTHFLWRAGTAIVLLSALVYALSHLTAAGRFTPGGADGLLTRFSAWLSPFFAPLGIASPALIAALLAGAFAKEAAAAALLVLPAAALPPVTAVCFLILFAIGPPCTATLLTMEAESPSRKRFLLRLLLRCLYAFALAAAVRTIAALLQQ